jgi:hypothetical protein
VKEADTDEIENIVVPNLTPGQIRRQAGLSRATLEISSEFSSKFNLRTHKT